MRAILSAAAILLLCLALSGGAFAQSTVGTITGIVTATDKTTLPGVTVRVLNEDTGLSQAMQTNDAGVYSFILAPGTNYTVSAELLGFKKATFKGITLHMTDTQRVDFTLELGEVTTNVVVDVKKVDPLLDLPNIGIPLDEFAIRNLPTTTFDPLTLLPTLPGYRASSLGHEFDTLGGLPMYMVNTVRDGLSVTDGFTPGGVGSTTILNTDMIQELRLILAPVDPESGRGNGQIQITTKSGTNKFQWNINYNLRQNALNSLGPSPNRVKQPFNAVFQYVVSVGGPVIKNRTFYFVNWDHQMSFRRPTSNSCIGGFSGCGGYLAVPALTDPARNGIFRWFDGWNSNNASFAEPLTATGTTASWPIDPSGIAAAPKFWPVTNAPYTGTLRCISVFGSIKFDGTPFDPATDCGTYIPRAADGSLDYAHPQMGVGVLPTSGPDWDGFGRVPDRTGYIQRLIGYMPHADHFYSNFTNGGQVSSTGADGLNRAAFDWVRATSGLSNRNTFNGGTFGTGLTLDQQWVGHRTINIKVDHNIDSRNRISASTSFQNDQNQRNGFESRWPDGVNGYEARIPRVLTLNGLSSITPNLVNEARFGISYNRSTQLAPWDNPANASQREFARSFLQQGWVSANSGQVSPVYYTPGTGSMDFSSNILPSGSNTGTGGAFFGQPAGGSSSTSCLNVTSVASTNCETGYGLYNFADTVSFNRGSHSIRAGLEFRVTRAHEVMTSSIPSATAGSIAATAPRLGTASMTPELPGFVTGIDGGLLDTSRGSARDLLYFLSGSVLQVSQQFWVNSVDNFANGTWETWDTGDGKQARNSRQNEYAIFLKDDWKIGKRLTLNLGVRYENYGNLYIQGFSTGILDGGLGLFGADRLRGDNPFDYWMTPGNYYVTGYGLTAPALNVTGQFLPDGSPSFIPGTTAGLAQTAAAQSYNVTAACVYGIQQSPLLPVSNCRPDLLTTRVFVGPGSNHPDQAPTYIDRNNVGPAIGFSYRAGLGNRTFLLRGGFQFTYGSAGRDRSVASGTAGILSQQNGGSTLTGAIDQFTASCGATTTCPGLDPNLAFTLADLPNITPLAPSSTQVPTLGGAIGASSGQNTLSSPALGSARVAAITGYAPRYQDARTENFTFSISTNLTRTSTVSVSYVGTLGKNRPTAVDINTPNVYHNPELLDALARTRAGEDVPLFDQMFAGLNISGLTATSGYGNVGTCVAPTGANAALLASAAPGGGAGNCPVGTYYQSGSAHLRRSATFQTNLANGNFNAVAASLATLNGTSSATNLSVLSSNSVWRAFMQGTAVRNGCDRLASATSTNHLELINGGAATGNSGPVRCFPEDYITTNPGGSRMTYKANWGYTNYQQLQVQYTLRLPRGVNMQATYLTSKTMALPRDFYKTNTYNYNSNGGNGFSSPGSTSGLTGFADPQTEESRRMDYGLSSDSLKHAVRLNGIFPVPVGPGQPLLGKTSGILGKLLGGWQMALILNGQSGQPFSIYAGDMLYGSSSGTASNCTAFSGTTFGGGTNCQSGLSFPDVVSNLWTTPKGKLENNGPNGSSTYYGNPTPFALIRDPQCAGSVGRSSTSDIGSVSGGVLGTFNLQNSCSLNALVMKVAPGTPGAFPLSATDPTPVLIMLQNPLPGHQGSLGAQTMRQPGRFYLDANLAKTFMFSERRGVQLRVDATNVLNHPQPADLYFSLGPGGTFSDQSTAALRSLANGCATQNTTGIAGCGRQIQLGFRMINN
ncbi:MAG TPA: TonB-dependent receptor [Terriglobia bacterium]|nr:TonB-dependent receptor [Terriglobia bacterium]